MEKNIKVEEDLWRRLNQEKLDKGYKKISDVIKDKMEIADAQKKR